MYWGPNLDFEAPHPYWTETQIQLIIHTIGQILEALDVWFNMRVLVEFQASEPTENRAGKEEKEKE